MIPPPHTAHFPTLPSLQLLDLWYGGDIDDKGILLVLTGMEDGALVGGEKFMSRFDPDLTESIVADTIPYWSRQDKPNRAVLASLERIMAAIDGKEDPGGVQLERLPVWRVQVQSLHVELLLA